METDTVLGFWMGAAKLPRVATIMHSRVDTACVVGLAP